LESIVEDGDVVLTLGAGSIGKASVDLASKFLSDERQKKEGSNE